MRPIYIGWTIHEGIDWRNIYCGGAIYIVDSIHIEICVGISVAGTCTVAGVSERCIITRCRTRSKYSSASVPNIFWLHNSYAMSVRNMYWKNNTFARFVLNYIPWQQYFTHRFDSIHTRPAWTTCIEYVVPEANACPTYTVMQYFESWHEKKYIVASMSPRSSQHNICFERTICALSPIQSIGIILGHIVLSFQGICNTAPLTRGVPEGA